MWNRVILLTAGFAFGWTLVHYWSAPHERLSMQIVRLILSLVVGLGFWVVLVVENPAVGVPAGLILALCALIAYAANAKQVNREANPTFLLQPEPSLEKGGRTAVVLAAQVEPLRYEGPAPWARLFRRLEAVGERIPHWFVRPRAYARIRAAYAAMGGEHPLSARIAATAQHLEARLGPQYVVRAVSLLAPDKLAITLRDLVQDGCDAVICLPVGSGAGVEAAIREQVSLARIREAGIPVSYAAPLGDDLWGGGTPLDRLSALMSGQPLPTPPEPPADLVRELQERVLSVAER